MIGLTEREVMALLLNSFLCGVCLAIIYDFIRAFKMLCGVRYENVSDENASKPLRGIAFAITLVTDIVFWLGAGVLSIILIYGGGGVFRGSIYLALAGGFLLYYFTLGTLVLKISHKITDFLKRILMRVALASSKKVRVAISGIISFYHLTIGRIFDKILNSIKSKNAKKQGADDASGGGDVCDCGKEGFVYVDGGKGYRRDGRISFEKRN